MYQRKILTNLKELAFCAQLGFFAHRVMPWTTSSAVQRDRRSKMRESGFSDVGEEVVPCHRLLPHGPLDHHSVVHQQDRVALEHYAQPQLIEVSLAVMWV